MKTVLLIQGGGCSPQTKKLRGELYCQREKRWRRRPNNQREKAVKRRRVIYYFIIIIFFLFLWIWALGDWFLGITVIGFGIYVVDMISCWRHSLLGCFKNSWFVEEQIQPSDFNYTSVDLHAIIGCSCFYI